MAPLGETPTSKIVREIDLITYDLFNKVSCRMGLFRMDRTKAEIRAIQDRLRDVRNQLIANEIVLNERVAGLADLDTGPGDSNG